MIDSLVDGLTSLSCPFKYKIAYEKLSIKQLLYAADFRDIKSGKVRAVIGQTYMLTQDEELWQKEMSSAVEGLLSQAKDPLADRSDRGQRSDTSRPRDKTKVVTYR